MRRTALTIGMALGALLVSGCRSCFLWEPYHSFIDCVGDHDCAAEWAYRPRFDISRAGKPDWCGPINSKLNPGRCYQGTWNGYDLTHHYPPTFPYGYPAQAVPPPGFVLTPSAQATSTKLPSTQGRERLKADPNLPPTEAIQPAPKPGLREAPPPDPTSPAAPVPANPEARNWKPRPAIAEDQSEPNPFSTLFDSGL